MKPSQFEPDYRQFATEFAILSRVSKAEFVLCSDGRTTGAKPVEVAIWERNHCFNSVGQEYLCQIIVWKWELRDGVWGYHVAAWAQESKCVAPDKIKGRWLGRFDGKDVSALLYMETYTLHDPEVDQRKRLPERERSGLK